MTTLLLQAPPVKRLEDSPREARHLLIQLELSKPVNVLAFEGALIDWLRNWNPVADIEVVDQERDGEHLVTLVDLTRAGQRVLAGVGRVELDAMPSPVSAWDMAGAVVADVDGEHDPGAAREQFTAARGEGR